MYFLIHFEKFYGFCTLILKHWDDTVPILLSFLINPAVMHKSMYEYIQYTKCHNQYNNKLFYCFIKEMSLKIQYQPLLFHHVLNFWIVSVYPCHSHSRCSTPWILFWIISQTVSPIPMTLSPSNPSRDS